MQRENIVPDISQAVITHAESLVIPVGNGRHYDISRAVIMHARPLGIYVKYTVVDAQNNTPEYCDAQRRYAGMQQDWMCENAQKYYRIVVVSMTMHDIFIILKSWNKMRYCQFADIMQQTIYFARSIGLSEASLGWMK